MSIAGVYREDKKSYVESREGEHFNLSVRTALAPAARIPYCFEHVLVCLTNIGEIRFTTDSPGQSTHHTGGDILLLPAGRPLYTDYIAPSHERPLECLTVELDRDLIARGLQAIAHPWPDRETVAGFYSIDDVSEFVSTGAGAAIRRLHRLLGGDETLIARDRLVETAHDELIVLLLQSHARAALLSHTRERSSRVAHLVDYIRANLREDLSVARLARQCHLSPSSLHSHCRASFGVSPAVLVRDCRVTYARELLRAHPRQSMKWIAREAGFSNAVHLTQSFKTVTGQTPSAYCTRPHSGEP